MALIVACGLAVVAGLLAITVYFVLDIYEHPTLPAPWSSIVVGYVIAGNLLTILGAVAGGLPLPFKDSTILLELKRLRETDPQSYERRLTELRQRNH